MCDPRSEAVRLKDELKAEHGRLMGRNAGHVTVAEMQFLLEKPTPWGPYGSMEVAETMFYTPERIARMRAILDRPNGGLRS